VPSQAKVVLLVDGRRGRFDGRVEHEQEDLLDVGGPRLPRWLRVGAALVVLVALVLLAVRVWPGSGTSSPDAVPPGSTSPPPASETPGSSPTTPRPTPWPTAPGACGTADLSIVSSTPAEERTGLRVLLGGDRLRVVDFDSGDVVDLPRAGLASGEYVDLAGNASPYATTSTCYGPARSTVLRVSADRRVRVVGSLGRNEWLLGDGERAWVVSNPTGPNHRYGSVRPLGGGYRVRLPADFYPERVVDGTLVGSRQRASSYRLLLVDATTGRPLADLGRRALVVAAGRGEVIWSTGCYASRIRPCDLHRRLLATGSTTSYRIPRPTYGFGAVSPDGTLLAFGLVRATTDPRYEGGHPLPPSDVAVLHLDTGRLEIVPGIEIPAKIWPGLAFSEDGRWLAIALNAGTEVRLLAWRSGLPLPYETAPITGQVAWAATVTTWPPVER